MGDEERWRAVRNASSKVERFCSNAGLERDGPQCVGCLKAAWLSMSTRAEGSVKVRGSMFLSELPRIGCIFVSTVPCLMEGLLLYLYCCFVIGAVD